MNIPTIMGTVHNEGREFIWGAFKSPMNEFTYNLVSTQSY